MRRTVTQLEGTSLKQASAAGSCTGPRGRIPQPLWASAPLFGYLHSEKHFPYPCVVPLLLSPCNSSTGSACSTSPHQAQQQMPWSLSAISHCLLTQLVFHQSVWMKTIEDKVRGLAKVRGRQYDLFSPFPHSQVREGNLEGQAHPAHSNSMLAVTNHLLDLCIWKWFPVGSAA